jgi:hypothetical protein
MAKWIWACLALWAVLLLPWRFVDLHLDTLRGVLSFALPVSLLVYVAYRCACKGGRFWLIAVPAILVAACGAFLISSVLTTQRQYSHVYKAGNNHYLRVQKMPAGQMETEVLMQVWPLGPIEFFKHLGLSWGGPIQWKMVDPDTIEFVELGFGKSDVRQQKL